jgi:hypothetical protein
VACAVRAALGMAAATAKLVLSGTANCAEAHYGPGDAAKRTMPEGRSVEELKQGDGPVVRKGRRKLAAYRDEAGVLSGDLFAGRGEHLICEASDKWPTRVDRNRSSHGESRGDRHAAFSLFPSLTRGERRTQVRFRVAQLS